MQFSFSLKCWQAASPCHHDLAAWQSWAAGEPPAELGAPPLPFVPAMQRRRLSLPAKLMFHVLHALPVPPDTPMVFASHDGEINRSFALWLQLLGEGYMSPMSFGLSVHNALSGLWSMFIGNHAEINAISASDAVLETALMEAAMLLEDGADEVVVVVVENPVQAQYDVAAVRAPFPFALALLVGKGDDYCLRFEGCTNDQPADNYWRALDWIGETCRGAQQWVQPAGNGLWYWQRRG